MPINEVVLIGFSPIIGRHKYPAPATMDRFCNTFTLVDSVYPQIRLIVRSANAIAAIEEQLQIFPFALWKILWIKLT